MANNIIGSEKQALGASLIVDGQQFPAKFLPSDISFTRNKLDVSHAQTLDFKQTKPEELAEPFTLTGEFYFDPRLEQLVELMKADGATKKREIYLEFPYVTLETGAAQEQNGYVYASEGFLSVDSISFDINDTMKASFTFDGGTTSPVIEHQQVVAANVATAITETNVKTATVVDGDLVLTLAQTGVTFGAPIFFNLSGADAAEFNLIGSELYAVGTPATGVKTLTVDVSGFTAYDQDITGDQLLAEAITLTLT